MKKKDTTPLIAIRIGKQDDDIHNDIKLIAETERVTVSAIVKRFLRKSIRDYRETLPADIQNRLSA